MILLEIFRRN